MLTVGVTQSSLGNKYRHANTCMCSAQRHSDLRVVAAVAWKKKKKKTCLKVNTSEQGDFFFSRPTFSVLTYRKRGCRLSSHAWVNAQFPSPVFLTATWGSCFSWWMFIQNCCAKLHQSKKKKQHLAMSWRLLPLSLHTVCLLVISLLSVCFSLFSKHVEAPSPHQF